MSSSFAARRSNRRIRVAAVVSVLLHGAMLAIPGRERLAEQIMAGVAQTPISVVIVPQPAATQPERPVEVPSTEPSPEPAPTPAPAKRPRAEPRPKAPEILSKTVPLPPPEPAPRSLPEKAVPMDMAALIEARRAQRRAAEANALANAQRRDVGPQVADSSAAQAIDRNLGSLAQGSEGTSGVFQILRKGTRTAEFAFNGWKPDAHRRWREVIEVDAGMGGDVELAIIRRMIQLIRTHYSGDFNWQSYKLGKVIVLSARPEDNAALEDFLSREFFDTPVLKRDNR